VFAELANGGLEDFFAGLVSALLVSNGLHLINRLVKKYTDTDWNARLPVKNSKKSVVMY
jgi:hypothetical protein